MVGAASNLVRINLPKVATVVCRGLGSVAGDGEKILHEKKTPEERLKAVLESLRADVLRTRRDARDLRFSAEQKGFLKSVAREGAATCIEDVIGPFALSQLIRSGVKIALVDVRSNEDCVGPALASHFENVTVFNIPKLAFVVMDLSRFDADYIVTVCNSGRTSLNAVRMRDADSKLFSLFGGYLRLPESVKSDILTPSSDAASEGARA